MSGGVWPGMVNCEGSTGVNGELVRQVVSGESSGRIDGSGVEPGEMDRRSSVLGESESDVVLCLVVNR